MRLRSLILCYHALSEVWPHPIAVSPAVFERQLRLLARRGLRGSSSAEILAGGRGLIHVTFDDAYRSVEHAVPVLERLRVPATVFVCSSLADTGAPLDVPELRDDLARYRPELATMRWERLRELAERGVEIGAHSVTHPHLTRLSDAELNHELVFSRQRIEDELGRPCRLLAYPYGEYDGRVAAAARTAGYDAAFTLLTPPWPSRYAVPRVGVYRKDGLTRLTLKTSPVWAVGQRRVASRTSA
jgi:peptidoglycan/xylan/chitin deacetylase (PgdA/CDA1 family)